MQVDLIHLKLLRRNSLLKRALTSEKFDSSACYDEQHVCCAYLQLFFTLDESVAIK